MVVYGVFRLLSMLKIRILPAVGDSFKRKNAVGCRVVAFAPRISSSSQPTVSFTSGVTSTLLYTLAPAISCRDSRFVVVFKTIDLPLLFRSIKEKFGTIHVYLKGLVVIGKEILPIPLLFC